MAKRSFQVTDSEGTSITSTVEVSEPAQAGGTVSVQFPSFEPAAMHSFYASLRGLNVGRPVANITISTTGASTRLDPAVEITITVTQADVDRAKRKKGTAFQIHKLWQSQPNGPWQWRIVKDNVELKAGPIVVQVTDTGDPLYTVGP